MSLVCLQFRKLAREGQDRSFTEKEADLMEAHRAKCPRCADYETSMVGSLISLRGSELPIEAAEGYTMRVAKKAWVVCQRDTARYWSPALCGAAVAGLLLIALVQLANRGREVNYFRPTTQDARRYPSLDRDPMLLLDHRLAP